MTGTCNMTSRNLLILLLCFSFLLNILYGIYMIIERRKTRPAVNWTEKITTRKLARSMEKTTVSDKIVRHNLIVKNHTQQSSTVPLIYVITVTYNRTVQKSELTNMCNVLSHVDNLLWILVEDSVEKTLQVKQFLIQCPVNYVHLNVKSVKQPQRTIFQRNLALDYITNATKAGRRKGVLYFADDDNTYDPRIFEQMRYTKGVSVWPVGFASRIPVETAIVEKGRVVDWLSGWLGGRVFPVDMAGFAVNVQLLLDYPKNRFRFDMLPGHLESQFIEGFNVTSGDLEPLAKNCTQVLVWHTKRAPPGNNRVPMFKFRKRAIPIFTR